MFAISRERSTVKPGLRVFEMGSYLSTAAWRAQRVARDHTLCFASLLTLPPFIPSHRASAVLRLLGNASRIIENQDRGCTINYYICVRL